MAEDALAHTIEQTLSMASPPNARPEGAPPGRAVAPQLPSGTRRYELLGELGRGGMGRVVEARDLQFGRRVAIKELHPGASPEVERRFALEALVTGNLEHPAIPTVYERGAADDGRPFYAMRRVPGRTLTDALAEAPDLAGRLKLVPVVTRAAQAIAFAHDQGVIHRDIKPHNIVVGPYGETVVVDWGIAKVRGLTVTEPTALGASPLTSPGTSLGTAHGALMGTPAYMAPEQARGQTASVDERSDVFALGAVLYHLLAGRAPYEGPTVEVTLKDASAGAPRPLRVLAAKAPPSLVAVCERAMAARAEERYRSAKELAEALEVAAADALAGRESGAVRWFARVAGIGALVVLLLTTWGTWGTFSSLREQGLSAFIYTGMTLVGVALSLIEWATRGRHRLAPLALAFALATPLLGIGNFGAGMGVSMDALATVQDPAQFRQLAARGMFETAGSLASTGLFGAIQLVLWGVARRRTLETVSSNA